MAQPVQRHIYQYGHATAHVQSSYKWQSGKAVEGYSNKIDNSVLPHINGLLCPRKMHQD